MMERVIDRWQEMTQQQRDSLLRRPAPPSAELDQVLATMEAVDKHGRQALANLCERFDGWRPSDAQPLEVDPSLLAHAAGQLDRRLKGAIDDAYRNITDFHSHQGLGAYRQEPSPGLRCERRVVPIGRVGLYIPAGSAPLFSTMLMLGIPAQQAGVGQIVVCSPTPKGSTPHPALLYSAHLCGVREFYRLGGAQAIAAMAGGGGVMQPVAKICGPGNVYVTQAKKLLAQRYPGLAIDLPAGPSELLIIADESSNPRYLAADMLSQAEHDPSAQVLLVSHQPTVLTATMQEISRQLRSLPRREIAQQALLHSRFVLTVHLTQAVEFANAYGPEHLSLAVKEERQDELLSSVKVAGSVFVGSLTAEAFGDYLSGTNHVLPTAGFAHSYSGVSVETFQRTFTVQKIVPPALWDLSPSAVTLARSEGLEGHARAVEVRLEQLQREGSADKLARKEQ